MTLSAITKDKTLHIPSLDIEQGIESHVVVEEMTALKNAGNLFCPHCLRRHGVWSPVSFRNSQKNRKHFFHLENLEDGTKCGSENYKHENESVWHVAAKHAVASQLKVLYSESIAEILVDQDFIEVDGNRKRKPDIKVVYVNGAVEFHEVQISPISLEDLQQRTKDLKTAYSGQNIRVVWYLFRNAYTKENRQWLFDAGISFYKLWFEDELEEKPQWKVGTSPIHTSCEGAPVDRCNEDLTHRIENPDEFLFSKVNKSALLFEVDLVTDTLWNLCYEQYDGRWIPKFKDMATDKVLIYTGKSDALKKQYAGLTLTVVSDDGAFATVIDNNGNYHQYFPLFNAKEVAV